ncbi:MAG TPA: ABC transporter permease [Alphaproteobacteria bacterium]|nr:ABC transporter permease [Alphaproteobacteria bacterium]
MIRGAAILAARIWASPTGRVGLVLATLLVGVAVAAPLLAPYAPTAIDVRHRLAPPEAAHWLGTDQLGRDVLSRVLVGTRATLVTALVAILASAVAAAPIGLVAGYGPRWADALLILLLDSLGSLPMIMLALTLAALLGPGIGTVLLVVVAYSVPSYARLVRAQVLGLRQQDFVLAARAANVPVAAILMRHLLPNVMGALLIVASMDVATVIALDTGLSFLGLGADTRVPDWGMILSDGFAAIRATPMLVIAAAVPLVLATLGFTFLGEALNDALDPKAAA